MPNKIKRLFSHFLWFLTIFCGIGLFTSLLASNINPADFWLPALLGLAFPLLFFINVFLLFTWIVLRKRKFILPLILLILALPVAAHFIAFGDTEKRQKSNAAKILSFNVRNFDLYNWSSNKQTRNKIFDFMRKEKADITCLQEFFNSTSKKDDFVTLDSILKFHTANYYHVAYTATLHESQNWGIATFSVYPIVNRGRVQLDQSSHNICIYTDLNVNEDTIRVYNMHLSSIHFQREDYHFLDSLTAKNNQEQITGSLSVVRKLKKAFIKRAEQTEAVLKSVRSSPYPVIICGDLNDTPSSYSYNALKKMHTDAFLESGHGIGQTYIGSFPSFRIDYIMHSPKISSTDFVTHDVKLSDHFPISCKIQLNTPS